EVAGTVRSVRGMEYAERVRGGTLEGSLAPIPARWLCGGGSAEGAAAGGRRGRSRATAFGADRRTRSRAGWRLGGRICRSGRGRSRHREIDIVAADAGRAGRTPAGPVRQRRGIPGADRRARASAWSGTSAAARAGRNLR